MRIYWPVTDDDVFSFCRMTSRVEARRQATDDADLCSDRVSEPPVFDPVSVHDFACNRVIYRRGIRLCNGE